MQYLVTGASGFLGLYIVERLRARGDGVRAACRTPGPHLTATGAEVYRCDLRDKAAAGEACRGVDVVIHAAGVAGVWGPWSHYYGNNVDATQHVLDGCRMHGVKRLVYTSSPSVTFDGGDQCGVDESAPYPTRWLCHYPHTKALAEQRVLAASGRHDLLTCALRPHLIWGPRDRHLVPRLLARADRLRRVGAGRNLVDMVYVENAARAHLQAADALAPGSPAAGRAYFISQGEPVNCWAWIDELLSLGERAPVRRSISLGAAWRLGAACEVAYRALRLAKEPPMTRFLAAQLGRSHYFDISAARRDFGFEPEISTQEGLRRTRDEIRKLASGYGECSS